MNFGESRQRPIEAHMNSISPTKPCVLYIEAPSCKRAEIKWHEDVNMMNDWLFSNRGHFEDQ